MPMNQECLKCPRCSKSLFVEAVLAACKKSWPRTVIPEPQLVQCDCPSCGKDFYLQVFSGRLESGLLDGCPGPMFMDFDTVCVHGLGVEVDLVRGAVIAQIDDRKFSIPSDLHHR